MAQRAGMHRQLRSKRVPAADGELLPTRCSYSVSIDVIYQNRTFSYFGPREERRAIANAQQAYPNCTFTGELIRVGQVGRTEMSRRKTLPWVPDVAATEMRRQWCEVLGRGPDQLVGGVAAKRPRQPWLN